MASVPRPYPPPVPIIIPPHRPETWPDYYDGARNRVSFMGAGLLVGLAFFVILASITFRLPLWQPLVIAIVAAALLFWLVPRMKRAPGR